MSYKENFLALVESKWRKTGEALGKAQACLSEILDAPQVADTVEDILKTGETTPDTFCETSETTLDTPPLTKLGSTVVLVLVYEDVSAAVSCLAHVDTTLGLDIETYKLPEFLDDKQAGLDPRKSGIRLIQIYDGAGKVYVFDIVKLGGLACLGEGIWKRPMVAHNAMFEMKHLMHGGVCPEKLGCSLLADRVLNGVRMELRDDLHLSKKATLKDLAKELLHLDISKEQQTSDWSMEVLSPAQIEYAALDAVLVSKIFALQVVELENRNLTRAYRIQRDAQHAVARMLLTGIGFDTAQHRRMIEAWQQEAASIRADILSNIGKELNLNSGKQLDKWLKEVLKPEDLESWAKTEKGQLSTSTHTFKICEHMHDIFPKLVRYRHVAKRISSFGDSLYKFIDVPANRLYGDFSLGATNTGRMASNHPNMQQMPRDGFRKLFVAKEGYQLVRLDYSQQELRVAALVTKDEALLKIYADGGDIHRVTASSLIKTSPEAVTKEQRQLAKAVIFGLLYGQGARGLARYAKQTYGVEMSEAEAEKHRNRLFKTYPGLRAWQKQTGDTVQLTQKVKTSCGRVRDFGRERKGYQYCAALNHPIQGAAAEITLSALARITPLLCGDCRLVNVVHDEILLEVREDKVDCFKELVIDAMESAFLDVFPESNPYLKNLVEAGVGKNWEEAH